MGKPLIGSDIFFDAECNPFRAHEFVEICRGGALEPTDIPRSFSRLVWEHASDPVERAPAPTPDSFLKLAAPAGFSETDYRAELRERTAMPVTRAGKGATRGKPQGPVLPGVPTGDPDGPITEAGAIAANRFGLGARPGELAEASVDPAGWLKAQLTPQAVLLPWDMPLSHECVLLRNGFLENPQTAAVAQAAIDRMETLRRKNSTPGIPQVDDVVTSQNIFAKILFQEIRLRDFMACTTRAPFAERLVRFWTNHFAVTANANTGTMVGDFERTVSRRFYLHKFSDLLIRSTLHPAMLHFLNNVVSVGPNSPYGQTIGNPPANENLAREALELHSMGSAGGYTQTDVEELAKALTGCITGFAFHGPERAGHFLFEPLLHEPGDRTVLGQQYGEDNTTPGQVISILNDIARHPATVERICRKLATHFAADNPPQALVDNLATVWTQTDGQLSAVYEALVDNPLAWQPTREKFKTPNDLVNSAARAFGLRHAFGADEEFPEFKLYLMYLDLGQFPFTPPTPEGWSDEGAEWAQPSPMMSRMQWANQVASRVGTLRPEDVLAATVGPEISGTTAFWTGGASNPQQGITLTLMSPEFQKR